MKRLLAVLAILAAACFAGSAGAQEVGKTLTGYKVSATQANTTTTFTTGLGSTLSVSIYNAGANEVFVNFGAAATTASAELPAGATITLTEFAAGSVGVICSTGETSTVYVYAVTR